MKKQENEIAHKTNNLISLHSKNTKAQMDKKSESKLLSQDN